MKTIIQKEVLNSDRIAIADSKGNVITYKELANQAEDLACDLGERSLIFCLCDHQTETVEFLYELLYLNMVPFLLEDGMDSGLLKSLIDRYHPQYLYCRKSYQTEGCYDVRLNLESHVLLKTDWSSYPIHPDVALLLSTSGTTGSPKLVKLSYGNLRDNAEHMCAHLRITSGQKGITPLAIHYVYGFTFYLWHWYCGATMLMTDSPLVSSGFEEFYVKERANNFAATPFYYEMLRRVDFWNSGKVEYLNAALTGGARMEEGLQKDLVLAMKGKLWNLYGKTECPIALAINLGDGHKMLGSVGKPLKDTEVSADQNTKELIIKSKSVCMGYASSREELADGDRNQGVLHTGDVVDLDGEGVVYLRGRRNRYIKILAKRVGLDDVESYLGSRYPGVEFACVGTDDHLCIFYTDTGLNLDEEVPALLRRKMKIYPEFVFCQCLEHIPRTQSGKIAYPQLMERRE